MFGCPVFRARPPAAASWATFFPGWKPNRCSATGCRPSAAFPISPVLPRCWTSRWISWRAPPMRSGWTKMHSPTLPPRCHGRSSANFTSRTIAPWPTTSPSGCAAAAIVWPDGPRHADTLDEADVEKLAALEHWRWCQELQSLGWRYAEIRDDFLKRHNRLVEWETLPDGVKDYNRDMARMLPQIADAAGMSLLPRTACLCRRARAVSQSMRSAQLVILADPRNAHAWHRARGAGAGQERQALGAGARRRFAPSVPAAGNGRPRTDRTLAERTPGRGAAPAAGRALTRTAHRPRRALPSASAWWAIGPIGCRKMTPGSTPAHDTANHPG